MPRRVSHPHLLSLCGSNAAVLHGRAAAQQHVAALGAAGCLTAGAPHLLLGCYGQHCQHCLGHGRPGGGRRSAGGRRKRKSALFFTVFGRFSSARELFAQKI
jgi:hypothetical protein